MKSCGRARSGRLEFLFLAPEQLARRETLRQLARARPSLFVVDEAHCVAEWGHDFRPEYLQLGKAIQALDRPRLLALTATAAAPVREEIISRLGMRDPKVIIQGFDRPNLDLAVEQLSSDNQKDERLLELMEELERPGIVYVATRAHADEVAQLLRERGFLASAYHAGHPKETREEVQRAFMDDELPVIVATTAFGMGVDKPRVAFVVHYDVPGSLDSYYQQIGRAGRDGTPARAILLYHPPDLGLQRFLVGGAAVDVAAHERIATLLAQLAEPVDQHELKSQAGYSASRLQTIINHLQEVRAINVRKDGKVRYRKRGPAPEEAAQEAQRLQEARKEFERSRAHMMGAYATGDGCRRERLLAYFGEEYEAPCGKCDRCRAGRGVTDTGEQPFAVGSRVAHESLGDGQVVRYEEGKVVILFDEIGYQELDLETVAQRNLLQQA